MDKQQAQREIRETFESSFDKNRFTGFIKNLLNKIEDAPFIYRGKYIPDAYKQYIKTLERVGKFSDGENRIDILIVTLQKDTSLERARTMQRNFIAWYLNGSRGGGMKDGALVAFVSPDAIDWRFSLVKMDYKFEKTKSGRMKVKEEFTPARRWSFLVGDNEKSHTAQSRLVKILANDEQAPTLEEIEKAFDIETVTKEFFLKYRELFLRTKEELDRVVKNDPKIKADFDAKGVDTVNFAKKLLGQIIFLYFLQKKGWFGVGRDDNWGTGSKHFLRQLFEKKHSDYKNFYNDILEPLFYEALRIDRSHVDGYYSRFNCKIPFLNGGLFDPIGNYDWVHTDIIIPDELFSNINKTKEDDTGDGILDIFDRYNFTVKEDEPLEKEVAIDPELLGKAYEKFNAIRPDNYDEFRKALKSGRKGDENKFNKKFGVYYTPREIVHYMCQHSLINYLATELGDKISKESIEFLILEGEKYIEYLKTAKRKKENNSDYKGDYKENQYFNELRKYANEIDQLLLEVKICDPAVGSGAFPVGMMTEIIKARMFFIETECLETVYINNHNERKKRIPYNFKRDCIEHSLYGVDIDPGAVEIAKLRLWLSLVVDEDDIKNIKPLPNLDYRIMQGNSLISEFKGISFDTNSKNDDKTSVQTTFLKDETEELIDKFQQKKDEFINKSNIIKKLQLKEEVEDLLITIFETKIKTQKADYFNRLKEIETKHSNWSTKKQRDEYIKQDKEQLYKEFGFDLESAEKQLKKFTSGRQIKPFFLWDLYFSEVFHNKGGFDVVIANPPYLKERDNKNAFESINNSNFGKKYHQGKMDYWYYFLHKAIDIVSDKGVISYITSRYWLNSSGAKKLIQRVKEELSFIHFIDIGKLKVFNEVAGHHMVAVYQRQKKEQFVYKLMINDLSDIYSDIDTENVQIKYLSNEDIFSDTNEIILEESIYDNTNIIKLGAITDISQGVVEAPDKLSNKQIALANKPNFKVGDGVFVLSKNEIMDLNLNKKEKLVLKKYLDPNDVDKYSINYKDKYLIYSDKRIKEKIKREKQYLSLKKHLDRFKLFITSSNKPYGLHRSREQRYFKKPKIIFKNMFVDVGFSFDNEGKYYFGFSFSSIIQKNDKHELKYILAILNSKFAKNWFYKNGKKRGAGVDIGVQKLRLFPIKDIDCNKQNFFIDLANKIMATTESEDYVGNLKKQAKVKTLEAEIDQLVYKLYGLPTEEIKIVENG